MDLAYCNDSEYGFWHQTNLDLVQALSFTSFVEENSLTSLGLSFPIWEIGIAFVPNP